MDVNIVQTEVCRCKREVISVSGRCGLCITEGAVAFWRYIDKEISLHDLYEALKGPRTVASGPLFPVPGDAVTCGLRTDVPKNCRRHLWASLGIDTRNFGDLGFKDCEISACVRCGMDKEGGHL